MKKFILFAVATFMTTVCAKAQETLITTDGEVMMVYIDDIGSTTIYYKTVDSANSQLQRIDKSKVYMIKRADGTKYDLGDTQTPTQQASTPAQPINKELSEEAKQRNKELIDALNKAASLPEPVNRKDKSAAFVYATLGVDENSVISNDDIELSYETAVEYNAGWDRAGYNTTITITITNKTNKTVFIDQANTFLVSNGESSPYYVPAAYSSSTSKTGDANAGTFAGAMGIHDYQTNISTSTVYSQRVVSIPPMSQKRLDRKSMFPTRDHLCCPGVYFYWFKCGKTYKGDLSYYFGENKMKIGETFSFSKDNSPLKFKCFVTYSFNEDCDVTNSVSFNLFMNKVIGVYWTVVDKNIKNYSTLYFFGWIRRGEKEGTVFQRP